MRGDGLGPAPPPQTGPQRLSHAQPQTSQKRLPGERWRPGQAATLRGLGNSHPFPCHLPHLPAQLRARPGWVALLAVCCVASSKAPPSLSHLSHGASAQLHNTDTIRRTRV